MRSVVQEESRASGEKRSHEASVLVNSTLSVVVVVDSDRISGAAILAATDTLSQRAHTPEGPSGFFPDDNIV